eukprot:6948589-Pyramimonas_sp.AAC.1
MEELARTLAEARLGVGFGIHMPAAWARHAWTGAGAPREDLTGRLLADIQQGRLLPSLAVLEAWPDLEASALEALDQLAPRRVVA